MIVKEKLPMALGVPLTTPVELLRLVPVGNEPLVSAKV
jgi:hypothetical protein